MDLEEVRGISGGLSSVVGLVDLLLVRDLMVCQVFNDCVSQISTVSVSLKSLPGFLISPKFAGHTDAKIDLQDSDGNPPLRHSRQGEERVGRKEIVLRLRNSCRTGGCLINILSRKLFICY